MVFRGLGNATFEQDAHTIRPLVMERGRLTRDVAASATSVYINSLPRGVGAYGGFVVIDPYTTECEVRQITARSGKILTIPALTYAHSKYDEVLFMDSPVVRGRWFGALGDDSTNDYTALSRALTAVGALDGVLFLDKGIYRIGTGLSLTDTSCIIGENVWNTELKATAAITMLTVGLGGGADCRNTRIENLRINGNSTANVGISVGDAPLSTFRNLELTGCTGTPGAGAALDHSQNQTWDTVRSTVNDYNLYIINGSANCGFFNVHGTAPNTASLYFGEDGSFAGSSGTPSGHGFYSSIFETGIGTATAAKMCHVNKGTRLYFAKTNFTRHASSSVPCIDIDTTGDQIVFEACRVNSNSVASVDMVTADGTDISFEHCWFTDLNGSTSLVTTNDSAAYVFFNSEVPTNGTLTATAGYIQKGFASKFTQMSKITTETIASGAITIENDNIALASEHAPSSDTLITINGGEVNDIICLRAASASVDIIIAEDAAGNINLDGDVSITLVNTLMKIWVMKNATGDWDELFRNAV